MNNLHVHLPQFEGPLALLLYLIRKEEMDIFDININQITREYLEHIKLMKKLDLEVAGEFISMAATLIHIKSKMLLPQYDEEGEIDEERDPRRELVQGLLEYQKFREISKNLYQRPLVGRDVWPRGKAEKIDPGEEPIEVEDNALFALIAAYRYAIRQAKKQAHRVYGKLQSISSRIMEIKDFLIIGKRILFMDLITRQSNRGAQALVTLLSLLELAKLGFVSVFQSEPLGPIHIETKKEIDRDVVSRAGEFDSKRDAEQESAAIIDSVEDRNLIEEIEHPDPNQPHVQEIMVQPEIEEGVIEAASDEEIAQAEAELGLSSPLPDEPEGVQG